MAQIRARLAAEFTVVATDMRGYGDPRSRRRRRSFRLFVPRHGAGSDRGDGSARPHALLCRGHDAVARAAPHVPDHEHAVARAAILDIMPQHHLFNNVTKSWATFSWHWFFMIQPYDFPEHLMSADPDFFIQKKLAKTKQGLSFFDPAALEEYKRYMRQSGHGPRHVRRLSRRGRYRSRHGHKDFDAGRKITCPVLLLWGATAASRNHKPAQGNLAALRRRHPRAKALPCAISFRRGAGGDVSGATGVFCRR